MTNDEATLAVLPEMAELWQQTLNWQPTAAQQIQFQRLYELILEGNRQLNLTRITAPEEFWEKHLWDSLRGIPLLKGEGEIADDNGTSSPSPEPASLRVVDIGTGAGFPGVPVAIVRPDWRVTLLDSTRKKITFLETLLASLGLENAVTCCDRAEQVGRDRQHREGYDLALIRAVATAAVCAEYALPLLKPGGVAVLYRGQWTEEEAAALQPAIERLGGVVEQVDSFTTPLTQGVRHCVHLRKTVTTAKPLPRSIGVFTAQS